MGLKLSILIPVHESHKDKFSALYYFLLNQYKGPDVEILTIENSGQHTKGYYRNELLSRAEGEYVAFIDADDWVSENYITLLLKAIENKPTHVSLKGVLTTNGQTPEIFEHSSKYSSWKTTYSGEVKYERYPNHLNCIRADIAKQFKFPEINHGEDHKWSEQVYSSGLLSNEFYIDTILYQYRYISK